MLINPFLADLRIEINIIESHNTYEISNEMIVPKKQGLDGVRAVKIFRTPEQKSIIAGLSGNASKLYLHILYTILPASDCLVINVPRYLKLNYIHSYTTYCTAKNELIRYGIIAKCGTVRQCYWINPAYFFCGSRPLKWPSKVVKIERNKRTK